MRAQEYFEQIKETVQEIERSREMLARLEALEDVKAQGYEMGFSGGVSDALAKTNRRMEFEQRLKRRIEEASVALDEATAILYGKDGKGGLAKLKSNKYADVLCMGYLQAMPWNEVADVMCCGVRWCHTLADAAFIVIDEEGMAKLKNI